MQILGLIFSNIHNREVFEVTEHRTIASTPIGGRYRLIDFPLSNMTNAGINYIGVVTKNNYQSLMDHLGSGKEWDLARKRGGLVILPPYGVSDKVYSTRLEAIKGIMSFISYSKVDYVVLTDCYHVCNIDYKDADKEKEKNKMTRSKKNKELTEMVDEEIKEDKLIEEETKTKKSKKKIDDEAEEKNLYDLIDMMYDSKE